MLIADVAKLPPLDRFLYWVRERWQVYVRRRADRPYPWTDDVVLQRYRFCNVRRVDDTVSQWLRQHWYTPVDRPNAVLAACLARHFNHPPTLAVVGYPTVWDPHAIEAVLLARRADGYKLYRGAYVLTGAYGRRGRPGETKVSQTLWRVCHPLYTDPPYIDTTSMRQTWRSLIQYQGLSSFMAGQIVDDLTWSLSGGWADKYRWAPPGIGSVRGVDRLLEQPLHKHLQGLDYAWWYSQLSEVCAQLNRLKGLPRLTAMDVQNCLCEWDKYERARLSQGRVRYYRG